MQKSILKMSRICKTFPGVQALQGVDFELYKGEVHALMGENGAGKSTLMKILNGMYTADSGSIELEGKPVCPRCSHDAIQLGISMIHQELSPIPAMTVAENIFLGHLPGRCFVNKRKLNEQTEALFKSFDLPVIPANVTMNTLSIAQIQLVEIVKAIAYKSRIIVMDEPTSAIADTEVELLFNIIRRLTASGVSIVYISHKMDEIFRISDRISVMRDGTMIGTDEASQTDQTRLINMMVGRDVSALFQRRGESFGDVKISVHNLCSPGCFENVSFDVRSGEILGITGLIGSKRTEVVEALFGLRPISSGKILIDGKEVCIKKPQDAIKKGNQQKVVLAKWLSTNPEILILDEPTRGIDVKAKQEIYMLIDAIAKQGKAVIVISSEMPEIMAISDRIIVMNSGRVRGVLLKDEINKEQIMRCALAF